MVPRVDEKILCFVAAREEREVGFSKNIDRNNNMHPQVYRSFPNTTQQALTNDFHQAKVHQPHPFFEYRW